MYYNDLEAMKAAIIEREEQTMNALYWTVNSQEELDELEGGTPYSEALREYLDDGGVLPCYVVPDEAGSTFEIFDDETEAVEFVFERL